MARNGIKTIEVYDPQRGGFVLVEAPLPLPKKRLPAEASGLKNASERFRYLLACYALSLCKKNNTNAADFLGLQRTTFLEIRKTLARSGYLFRELSLSPTEIMQLIVDHYYCCMDKVAHQIKLSEGACSPEVLPPQ